MAATTTAAAAAAGIRVTYQAMRLHGTGAAGVRDFAPDELAAWVRSRYDAGWRRLVVIDCSTGERVGWIGRDPDTGRRTWSAANPWPPNPNNTGGGS